MKITNIEAFYPRYRHVAPSWRTHFWQIVVRVETDNGTTGLGYGGGGVAGVEVVNRHFRELLVGRQVDSVEDSRATWDNLYTASLPYGRKGIAVMALSAVDNALWDIAGKLVDLPIYQLLGGYRRDLPCYASTDHGDSLPGGLSSPEAYADFAEQCGEMGYPAFKLHVWGYDHSDTHGAKGGTVQRDVDTMHAVGKRVGDKMDLMLDGSCAYRTFHDALTVGRALDDEGFMWYEDPYSDGGISAQGHRKLKELLRTPLLMTEMVRGLEPKVDFIVSGGTDFVRADLGFDGGITGVMKIAHVAEGFGLDVEIHGNGPAHRHCMAAIRNSNYYEMGLLHPKIAPMRPPVYADGYRDAIDAIDSNGCVQVPDGPGLGVTYDWDFIREHETGVATWD